MQPNGRGTGLECDPDRLYLAVAMLISAGILEAATDKIVEVFPVWPASGRGWTRSSALDLNAIGEGSRQKET